jgi:hypothetical protein
MGEWVYTSTFSLHRHYFEASIQVTVPPGKEPPQYLLDRRLDVSQSRSGRRGEVKILDPTVLEIRALGRPARSQSQYRLSYQGFQDTCKIPFKAL